MSRFSRWYASAVQADSERKTQKKLLQLPDFPWEMTPSGYLAEVHEKYEYGELSGIVGSTSPYGLHTARELQSIVGLLDPDQPLASALLAFPVSQSQGKTDNQNFSRRLDEVIQKYESRDSGTAPVLFLDCHVKNFDLVKWRFRPAGFSKYFSDSFLGRGLADEVPEDSTRRLISLVELEVNEGDRGPDVEFYHIKSFDPEVFDTLTIPQFPGLSLAESTRLQIVLARLLERFRFSRGNPGEYATMRAEYLRLLQGEVWDTETSSEASDLQERWSEFVVAHYPEASVPLMLDIASRDRTGGYVEMPAARLIRTPRDAEEYAAEVMEAIGFTNVRLSPVGPDGGIDVTSDEALAQVKLEGRRSTREQLQRLTGITLTQGTAAIFFSLAGYTKAALDWAEATDMALFEFAYDGSLDARSSLAVDLYEQGSTALLGRE